MFDKWLRLPAHLYLRITALTILIIGITLSNVLMSIGAIWIIANWLIQADFPEYWQKFKIKKSIWWIVAIYCFIAVSIFWSADSGYGFKDLRVKLPFIVIPLVLATSKPLEKKHFYFLLYVFIGAVIYTSGYNYIRYNYGGDQAEGIREMSYFISHVRLSVLLNFALFSCLYLIHKRKFSPFIWLLAASWILFYLYKSQVITGYLLFGLLTVYSILFFIHKIQRKSLKRIAIGLGVLWLIASVILGITILNKVKVCDQIAYNELDEFTVNGNPYFHDTANKQIENGHYVWLYVNKDEMSKAWESRSAIAYDSTDNIGQPMFGTLMRYLTSKNLRKDSAGVMSLTNQEVGQIENGKTGLAQNKGLITRLNAFMMEYTIYKNGGDPNGNSLIQRIEHFDAAIGILKTEWLLGVGAGDVPTAFTNYYAQSNSRLFVENQHRSHNQFLTLWVGLGIGGVVLFLLVLITPFFELKQKDYFFGIVFIGLIISCCFQDLIETQAGVTIFALFYSLAIYRDSKAGQKGINP